MAGIWSEEYKFSRMLDVEVLAVEAQHKLGRVPKRSLDKIKRLAAFDVRRINEREKITHHDVVAFIDEVCSHIGTEARYFHLGLTSSDILDTALSLQMRRAADIILGGVRRLARLMLSQAKKYKYTACIGRTHGVHAEPLSFGLKLLSWFSELRRQEALLLQARDSISFGKLSGAVGTYSNIDPFVERYVCRRLGLRPEPVATQVIPRDRHALYLGHLAVVGRGLARFALEIR
ncbi:MAG: lyase family protein, partial [Candidatus Omnitrophota bacterium]